MQGREENKSAAAEVAAPKAGLPSIIPRLQFINHWASANYRRSQRSLQDTISTGCKATPPCSPGAEKLPTFPNRRKLVPAELDLQTPKPLSSLGHSSTADSIAQDGGVLVPAGPLHVPFPVWVPCAGARLDKLISTAVGALGDNN